MAVAGVNARGSQFIPTKATKAGIQKAVDITAAATRGNYVGPLVAAITFVSPSNSRIEVSPEIQIH